MRLLFMGTASFAVPALQALLDAPEHTVLAVVTQPDRPHGRGNKVLTSPVKDLAVQAGLPIHQPEKVRRREFVDIVRALAPDALVVAAFGQIIPQKMLDIPKYSSINIHGSLLPRWRGAAPMQYCLMAGDAETGVTTMLMDAGLDTGAMLLQRSVPLVDEDNIATVEAKLAPLGAELLLETLTGLEQGTIAPIPQDPDQATHAPSLPPDIGAFDWTKSARTLHNLVRGLTPKPGAYTFWNGQRLKIWRTEFADSAPAEAGEVHFVDKRGITVGTGDGLLRLVEVQPESKGRMAADAWGRGARITPGQRFGARE
jgi:methionyl-tRNA formyltransferase